MRCNLIVKSAGHLGVHMSGSSPVPSVRPALGGVGKHVVPPLLVLLLHGVIVLGVGGAHDEQLLVLDLVVAVAAPLLRMGHVLDASR